MKYKVTFSYLQTYFVKQCDIKDLGLGFTLPGYESIDLCYNGSNETLTQENL